MQGKVKGHGELKIELVCVNITLGGTKFDILWEEGHKIPNKKVSIEKIPDHKQKHWEQRT